MKQDIVRRFFTGTGETYDLIVNLFTYGADRYWKRCMLAKVPAAKKVLDLACGTGILTFKLARQLPQSRIVGVDMMAEYLAVAAKKLKYQPYCNIRFVCARAEQVALRETFDCMISSYIPKYVAADKLLTNVGPFLRTGGILVIHDFAYPKNDVYKKLWHVHMRLMKLIGTPLFPNWRTIFGELDDLVKSTRWIEEYLDALERFGFKDIEVKYLTAGSAAVISAKKGKNRMQED